MASDPSDVVDRAKSALSDTTDGPWIVNRDGWACVSSGSDSVIHGYFEGSCPNCGDEVHDAANVAVSFEDAEFIAAARSLVPELVAEVERLRAGGPWVEHVEFMNAMKRQRDGDCICDHSPETDGPDEFCPWHGRPYREVVEVVDLLAGRLVDHQDDS